VSEKLRVDVLARGERFWATNAREFDTPEQAMGYAVDLSARWRLVEKIRVVPVSHPRRERYVPGSEDASIVTVSGPLFPLGWLTVTPGAAETIARQRINVEHLLARHAAGDWGDIDEDDWAANNWAVQSGTRIHSAYGEENDPDRLYVITEANRRVTTILLPGEY